MIVYGAGPAVDQPRKSNSARRPDCHGWDNDADALYGAYVIRAEGRTMKDMAVDSVMRRRRPSVLLRIAAAALVVAAAASAGIAAASAAPIAGRPAFAGAPYIVKVLTTCDTRGCFTFGPRQSYHRPDYRPLGQTGPLDGNPRAARPPRFIFRPLPQRPLPHARLPAADPSFHRQTCMNRYRSYNPLTDSYIGSGGRPLRCVLPERQ
jgi:hypothetical protein